MIPETGKSYTTGDVAKICRVSQQTAIRWIDNKLLTGRRIPGSKFRRVFGEDLIKFMKENGMESLLQPEVKAEAA